MEQPVLWLGLAGFSPQRQAEFATWLAQSPAGWPQWRCAKFLEADAWWIAGTDVRLLEQGSVLSLPMVPDAQDRIQLNLGEIDRPVAFTTPLAPQGFEPKYTFDPASEKGARAVLQQFEGWLRPLRAQFALGAEILAREQTMRPGVYHLSVKGSMVAVVDLHQWLVALAPTVRPVDVEQATWNKRPAAAKDIPERFMRIGLSQLMWAYAQRTERDVLPQRYRQAPLIYWRRSPRVPMRWLKDSHLLLLRELSQAPGGFDELRLRTGVGPEVLARDLASLYFAGAITTSRASAHEEVPASGLPAQEAPRTSLLNSQPPWGEGDGPGADPTAPAPLRFD